jgi:hypothetical protein
MPTIGPDGSIRLDTSADPSTGSMGPNPTGANRPGYSDNMFRDDLGSVEGIAADRGYEHYQPAFQYGWESAHQQRGRDWTSCEADLERDWRSRHADRDWAEHRSAVRHAFERAMHVFEGAKDPDERK